MAGLAGITEKLVREPMHPRCLTKVSATPQSCAPNFVLQDLKGRSVDLSKYANKVVVLHFWATWCEPCRDEIPTLIELEKQLRGKPIAIISVSLDNDLKQIDRFFQGAKPAFPILLDPKQKLSTLYGTFKVPETFIIDRGGRIRDKIIGSRYWLDGVTVNYLKLLANLNKPDK